MTFVRSVVPRFRAVPSSTVLSAAAIIPFAMSPTYVQFRICVPSPHTSNGFWPMKARAIIAITAWFSTPRSPYTVKSRQDTDFKPWSR